MEEDKRLERYSVESTGLLFSERPPDAPLDKYKLVLLGDVGVGKTSIAYRFIFDEYADKRESTFGATFLTKIVDRPSRGDKVRLQVWDTAGQERFRSLAPMYYKNAHGALVVFDLTDLHTYMGAKSWIRTIREEAPKDIVVVLAGNKLDKEAHTVRDAEVKAYCESEGVKYLKCSAKTNQGVVKVFAEMVAEVRQRGGVQDKRRVRLRSVDGSGSGGGEGGRGERGVCSC